MLRKKWEIYYNSKRGGVKVVARRFTYNSAKDFANKLNWEAYLANQEPTTEYEVYKVRRINV